MPPIPYPGSATLEETCTTIAADQADNNSQLVRLEPVVNKKSDGSKVKLNLATYEPADILEILDDVKCIDVSTPQGAADAAAAQHDYKPIWSGEMWVQDTLTEVQILGRTSS
jgi:hypothetical protein